MWQEILAGCRLAKKTHDATLLSHHTFLLGDLNFRTAFEGMDKNRNNSHAYDLCVSRNFKALAAADELTKCISDGECLADFLEGDISAFPPTFKVKRGVAGDFMSSPSLAVDDMYNSARTPSYCDRILYTSLPGLESRVHLEYFRSSPEYTASDHNPVCAGFVIDLDPSMSPIMPPAVSERPRSISQLLSASYAHHNEDDVDDEEEDAASRASAATASSAANYRCVLTFSELRGTGLTEMDSQVSGGLSDPYIVFVPLSSNLFSKKCRAPKNTVWSSVTTHSTQGAYLRKFPRTHHIARSVNPTFKDRVELELCPSVCDKSHLANKFIALTVMDHDDLSEDDQIGAVVLNCGNFIPQSNREALRKTSFFQRKAANEPHVFKTRFDLQLMRNGTKQGRLEGVVEVEFRDTTGRSLSRHNSSGAGLQAGAGGCCSLS